MLHVYEKENVTCIEMNNRLIGKVFAFLIDGMLVDTGPPNMKEKLLPLYEKMSMDVVVLTHHHEDHTGLAPWIQHHKQIPIYIHPNGVDICTKPAPYPKYRQTTWGYREVFQARPLGNELRSRTKEWEVIHTPGHSDDHVALYNKQTGIVFTGDLFVQPRTKVMMSKESVPQIMQSLRTILTLDISSMFCCHAGYIEDGKAKIRQKLTYLETLTEEVNRLHRDGLTVHEINQTLFPQKHVITSVSEGEWDSLHMVTSILENRSN